MMKDNQKKSAAIKYEKEKDGVPTLVAKGKGKLAERIIEIAHEHGIPIKEDRELVEFLSALDLYQEIPSELYKAVAEVLAFIYSVNKKSKA